MPKIFEPFSRAFDSIDLACSVGCGVDQSRLGARYHEVPSDHKTSVRAQGVNRATIEVRISGRGSGAPVYFSVGELSEARVRIAANGIGIEQDGSSTHIFELHERFSIIPLASEF